MDYFEYSQEIRREIEEDIFFRRLLEVELSGIHIASKIGEGANNGIYRIGRLKSGLFVALRQSKKWRGLKDYYETYATNAERYSSLGHHVPRFCIGVEKGDRRALLLEDLTEGGKRNILESNPIKVRQLDREDELSVRVVYEFEDTHKEVYTDLDEEVKKFSEYKYMADSAMIRL